MESFSDLIVGWMPFYWLGKCAFLLWCMSPLNGSAIVYRSVNVNKPIKRKQTNPERIFRSLILPIFRQNEEAIDKVVNKAKEGISEITESAANTVLDDKKSH